MRQMWWSWIAGPRENQNAVTRWRKNGNTSGTAGMLGLSNRHAGTLCFQLPVPVVGNQHQFNNGKWKHREQIVSAVWWLAILRCLWLYVMVCRRDGRVLPAVFFSRKQLKSDEFAGKVVRRWSKNHKRKVWADMSTRHEMHTSTWLLLLKEGFNSCQLPVRWLMVHC